MGLKQRKLLDEGTLSRTNHSSIFVIQVKEEVYKNYSKTGALYKARLGVRLSVHFYNTRKDRNFFDHDKILK